VHLGQIVHGGFGRCQAAVAATLVGDECFHGAGVPPGCDWPN
jgi:hypothetical protein